ncbi:hypothetical protein GCM10010286_03100 [Streptomyces toxytricini]|nr:hypothetical protein GCM10010286_03100 [Streptomyces toxytricini]
MADPHLTSAAPQPGRPACRDGAAAPSTATGTGTEVTTMKKRTVQSTDSAAGSGRWMVWAAPAARK